MLIDRVVLAALDRIEENLGGLLNTLEKAVILRAAGGSLLVGVMSKNLLAVGALDLVFSRLESVF